MTKEKKIERILGKWQHGFRFSRYRPQYGNKPNHPNFQLWCCKLTSFPVEGFSYTRKNYKGFILDVNLFRTIKREWWYRFWYHLNVKFKILLTKSL